MLSLCTLPGCYYSHLAGGQARVLWARRTLDDVLEDPSTDAALRDQLRLVERARLYARDLGLEVDGQYTSYVPWPSDRMITSLIVTEPGRIEARPFDFPIVGEVPYKGFFDQERAEAEAAEHERAGRDTCLLAVPAYSTLGFFDDPLTDPMLRRGDGQLVETVLHELVHATVYIAGEPGLSEGAANFFGEEASVRFFAADPDQAARRRAEVDDDRRLARALMAVKDRIASLYANETDPIARQRRRIEIEDAARAEIAALPLVTRDPALLAARIRLGDACLAVRGTYVADGEHHESLLRRLDGDLSAYVQRLRAAAEAEDPRVDFFGMESGPTDPR
jgi:predicted aminopeptidase